MSIPSFFLCASFSSAIKLRYPIFLFTIEKIHPMLHECIKNSHHVLYLFTDPTVLHPWCLRKLPCIFIYLDLYSWHQAFWMYPSWKLTSRVGKLWSLNNTCSFKYLNILEITLKSVGELLGTNNVYSCNYLNTL